MNKKTNSQHQGRKFENLFVEFLKRIIQEPIMEFEFNLCEPRKQADGQFQFGYDVRAEWRDKKEEIFKWAFECKSHKSVGTETIPTKQFADKILAIYAHSDDISCFGLVSPLKEFNNIICDYIIPILNRKQIGSYIFRWTQKENLIRQFFELYPDIYEEVYGLKMNFVVDEEVKKQRLLGLKEKFEEINKKGLKCLAMRRPEAVKTMEKTSEDQQVQETVKIVNLIEEDLAEARSIQIQLKYIKKVP